MFTSAEIAEIEEIAKRAWRTYAAKGGKARAKKLSRKRRVEIAKLAAETRWGRKAVAQ